MFILNLPEVIREFGYYKTSKAIVSLYERDRITLNERVTLMKELFTLYKDEYCYA